MSKKKPSKPPIQGSDRPVRELNAAGARFVRQVMADEFGHTPRDFCCCAYCSRLWEIEQPTVLVTK